ncbi:DUF6313 family protein [Streptomyces sp. NPDC051243]|uniref:DUF6313 family protein n=1 Tax=Streptomyces sp. NPDC051243 TaxID=3365646 RepID=UPI0037AA2D25
MLTGPIPIPPDLKLAPVKFGTRRRLRRVWRSRKALKGITQWMIDWGAPMAVGAVLLYIYAARSTSPSEVYKAFTLIDPPDVGILWGPSLIGWLLVPAIIGGVAGHVIATRISRAKSISTETLFRQRTWGQRLKPPGLIHDLRRYFHGSIAEQDFVDAWVRVAHRNDWDRAQDHWEVFVRDMVSTQQYADLDRHECLRQAQGTARLTLLVTAQVGLCIVCERRR